MRSVRPLLPSQADLQAAAKELEAVRGQLTATADALTALTTEKQLVDSALASRERELRKVSDELKATILVKLQQRVTMDDMENKIKVRVCRRGACWCSRVAVL
jgi:septal ring factor EnvC (AmiA/AmiB activator)